mmetsp:Transcript_3363/g.2814  ORF Transcript_3363/g.2814 Transcript_3363/m.2814 type:complete len:117 (+) Transcript_3363:727-1077(+)
MIRGANNLIGIIVNPEFTLRLRWVSISSIYFTLLGGVFYIMVDIVPSLYLSFGIWLNTNDYLNRQKEHNSIDQLATSRFTLDDPNEIDEEYTGDFDPSIITTMKESNISKAETINE